MNMVRKQSSAQLLKSLSLADLQKLLEKKLAEDAKRVAVPQIQTRQNSRGIGAG